MSPRTKPGRAPKGEGYFYRRYRQKEYPLSANVPGTIYYQLRCDGETVKICCHTKSEKVARELVSKHLTEINLTTAQKFLKSIDRAGQSARKKLDAELM